MNSYRIVIVSPSTNAHSAVFTELAIALTTAIRDNGFNCDIKTNELHPTAINVILGFHLLTEFIPTNIRYIVYQLEQLSESEGIFAQKPAIIELLKRAEAVWDYSPENVRFLMNRGVTSQLIPVGFSPTLEKITTVTKDNDILFYGSRNERRGVILQELLNRGYKVKALFGLYGEERDSWIARSKLIINIHFYEANLFESVRVSYLINNGIPVLSEQSPSYPWSSVPLELVPYNQLADKAEEMLTNLTRLEEYGTICKDHFVESYALNELIAPLLS